MSNIQLPALIYSTPAGVKSSDDLSYGDLTEQQLKSVYHLDDVSTTVDPYAFTKKEPISLSPTLDYGFFNTPSSMVIDPFGKLQSRLSYPHEKEGKNKILKEECANLLFDEFRSLSRPFALYGAYSGLIVKMINHMQNNSGRPFRDSLLNMALNDQIRHDFSGSSSLKTIQNTLHDNIDWKNKIFPAEYKSRMNAAIAYSILPKFRRFKDGCNGLGITIHDTFATQITLNSLSISGQEYSAHINYKVQDHFGLDKSDIFSSEYSAFRFFRIWFVLQRWEQFGFKPFVTEMEATVNISGWK